MTDNPLIKAARKVALAYEPKLPPEAIITVSNGDLRELHEAIASMDERIEKWSGFNYVGSEVAPPGSL